MSFVIILFSLGLWLGSLGILLIKRKETSPDCRENQKLDNFRSITVVIVARNEEAVIHQMLASLSKIEYPTALYEIILVDDCSQDSTGESFEVFAALHENVSVIRIEATEKILPGKKEGLQRALTAARNEIILLTDADCLVSPLWLKDCSRYWDDDTKMLVGYAPEDYEQLLKKADSIGKFSFYFRRFMQIVSAGNFAATTGLGVPFSCYGRNLAVSRKLLLDAGGYRSIGKEVSGDDKQVLNLMRKQPGKIKYSPLKNVITFPELKSFHEQQKRRLGKIKMSSPFYFFLTLLIIGFFIYLPFRVLINRDFLSYAIFYLSSLVIWLINLWKHREKFVILDLLFLIIYPYYLIYYTILGTQGNWVWK